MSEPLGESPPSWRFPALALGLGLAFWLGFFGALYYFRHVGR
jgi:hypothetical protein